jgi:hypothetical protein
LLSFTLAFYLIEKLQMSRLFQNGEMRGTKKIQGRSVLKQVRVWIFCSDEADRRFGAAC